MSGVERVAIPSSASQLLIQCLERFEGESQKINNRDELVRFFCQTVLPFLAENALIRDLRGEWGVRRAQLQKEVLDYEERAMAEVVTTFHEIKDSFRLKPCKEISQHICLLDGLVGQNQSMIAPPLYRAIYDELKALLHLMLHAGYKDLCVPHAKIASEKKYVPVGPSFELRDECYIETFEFAPSVIRACQAIEDVHVGRLHDPAIVWWYFESAMWCWKTPRLYFEQVPKNDNSDKISFQMLCNMSAWMEIAAVRDRPELQPPAVIFTNDLFQKGLGVVINAIGMFLAGAPAHVGTTLHEPEVSFTLVLDGNELWVHATFENQATEKFFIQAFHEGDDGEGSSLFKFVKSIFSLPQRGERKASLLYKWESPSKHISRLRLPPKLKQAFFERKSHGKTYYFAGARIRMKNAESTVKLLRERR